MMCSTWTPMSRSAFPSYCPDGLSSKDFIAPTSFDFREGKCFKMGKTIGAVSFLQLAQELNDRMLADFLEMDSNITRSIFISGRLTRRRQSRASRSKITDLDKMKIEEQKRQSAPATIWTSSRPISLPSAARRSVCCRISRPAMRDCSCDYPHHEYGNQPPEARKCGVPDRRHCPKV